MTVLTIRANKRFAVCRKAVLGGPVGKAQDALLIEVSLDGCRIGNCDPAEFAPGDTIRVTIEGIDPFEGAVRWHGDRAVGLKLDRPFHIPELDRLIRTCRGEFDALPDQDRLRA